MLREQAEHMDAPDRCSSLYKSSCAAGVVHTWLIERSKDDGAVTIGLMVDGTAMRLSKRPVAIPALSKKTGISTIALADGAYTAECAMMNDEIRAVITATIARAPEWVRQELLSKEPATRTRAEEALAAMIAGALTQAKGDRSAN